MVKHTQTIRRLLLTNCLSVFDHFIGLALKGLRDIAKYTLKLVAKNTLYDLKIFHAQSQSTAAENNFFYSVYFEGLLKKKISEHCFISFLG